MTRLRVSTRTVCPYTRADILTNKYPELFKDARKQARRLVELQKQSLALMPALRDELLNTRGMFITDSQYLRGFGTANKHQHFIFLRSLFAFTEEVWKLLDDACRKLAEAENNQDSYNAAKLKWSLTDLINGLEKMPLDDMLDDEGLYDDWETLFNAGEFLQRPKLDYTVWRNWTWSKLCHELFHPSNGSGGLSVERPGPLDSILAEECPDLMSTGELLTDDIAIGMHCQYD